MPTKIEWCDETWNPITGCAPTSAGCANCYAKRMSARLRGRFGYPADDPFRPGVFHAGELEKPLRWKKPRRVFVCSMGDIFHDAVSVEDIDSVLEVIGACQQHTFMMLTKRPESIMGKLFGMTNTSNGRERIYPHNLPNNLQIGVTVENQATADARIHLLLQTPAAVRFVSYEPALGPVDFSRWLTCESCLSPEACWCGYAKINGIIAGGETGPGARPAHPDWFRSVRDQCAKAGVPFMFKSWGAWVHSFCATDEAFDAVNGSTKSHNWGGAPEYDNVGFMWLRRDDVSFKVGKRLSGRLLDGREHNGLPNVDVTPSTTARRKKRRVPDDPNYMGPIGSHGQRDKARVVY